MHEEVLLHRRTQAIHNFSVSPHAPLGKKRGGGGKKDLILGKIQG
jgi:hypothetical protein